MEIWQIWVIAALVLFIVEIMTSGFAIACLSVGCLFAAVGSAFELSLAWQIGLFALGSFLAFIFIRPLVLKLMNKNANKNNVTTNTDNLIGRKAVVTEKIENDGYGRVKIDGDDWKARMEDDGEAEVGEKVTIVSQESVILTVKK
ncbi:MAG: NfeD family protein [Bacteroidales bacterium]|nr:NfeD family protein [Bacteroidales bacterium]